MKNTSSEGGIITRLFSTLLIPMLFTGYGAYFFRKDARTTLDWIIFVVLILIGIAIVANLKFWDRKYTELLLWFRAKDVVYKSIKMRIEYLDQLGERVAFVREEQIANVSLKQKQNIPTYPLVTTGEIIQAETSSVNGYYSFPTKQKGVFKANQANLTQNGLSVYSTVLKNAFLEKSEFFSISVKNDCMFCQLEVVLPLPLQFSHHYLKKRFVTDEDKERSETSYYRATDFKYTEEWHEVMEAKVLKQFHHDKTTLTLYLENLDPSEEFKLEWDLN